jgi:tripartite ATP-independent transporter DctM subunit
MIGIVMFFAALLMLLFGFPVAFTFGAVAVVFGMIAGIFEAGVDGGTLLEGLQLGRNMFAFMPHRIWSIMNNTILMAIPLFIYMGIVLQKTRLAERLLESMGFLFGEIRGGLAISTVLVGSLLAASTGVVGASVVAMGVISLPVMMKYNYSKELATGTICAAGTLGQIIPPSIVLIILGDVFQVPVGDLFQAAVWPGLYLVGAYIFYIVVYAYIKKDAAPPVIIEGAKGSKAQQVFTAIKAIVPPLVLIVLVLGSIFGGVATPTESAAVGGVGAILLSMLYREFSFKMTFDSALETVLALPGEKWGFLILSMIAIMLLGFFIDFIEISYIIVPILVPIAETIGINPVWYAILIAMNLQTSFLTPPFGFSLFYLKGVAPPEIKTMHIYRGVLPFILIQGAILLLLILFPHVFGINPLAH